MNKTDIWTDLIGVVASIACAIHCAAMPFIVGFLPAMGLSFLADDSFHKIMVGVCSLLAASAFIPGLRRHGRRLPVMVATGGLVMISVAAFALEDECCSSCDLPAPSDPAKAQLSAEACCEHCVTDSGTLVSANAPTSTPNSSFSNSFLPWITPFGGLLLVTAHLTNRRFSCSSGCCKTE